MFCQGEPNDFLAKYSLSHPDPTLVWRADTCQKPRSPFPCTCTATPTCPDSSQICGSRPGSCPGSPSSARKPQGDRPPPSSCEGLGWKWKTILARRAPTSITGAQTKLGTKTCRSCCKVWIVIVDLFQMRWVLESAPWKQAANGTWEMMARPPTAKRLYTLRAIDW